VSRGGIVLMTTVPRTARILLGAQCAELRERGWDVHVASSPGEDLDRLRRQRGVSTHSLPMTRRISPLADWRALLRTVALLRRIRPAIVHAHTPKAAFLGMAAAAWARTPVRICTINGLPLVTRRGPARFLIWLALKMACGLATEAWFVSQSLRRQSVAMGICGRHKSRVIGNGGSHGVDCAKFSPEAGAALREPARARLQIPEDAFVVGFAGRLVADKGIAWLAGAWTLLRRGPTNARLMLCGDREDSHPALGAILAGLAGDPHVIFIGFGDQMPALYSAMDAVVLPSLREGLSNVILEAGAMGLPVVASDIPGCRDAVRNGETGILVPPANALALADALQELERDAPLRRRLGTAARHYIAATFEERRLTEAIAARYEALARPPLTGDEDSAEWRMGFEQ
jgi:glycosyltransferase involved in cell wall biosynthesis